MNNFKKKTKKRFKPIIKYWKNNPIELIRIILEIIIVFGLITYFTYKQTNILNRQLELQERQQNIAEQQLSIFKFEHSPRFQIEEYSQRDSLGVCKTEEIYVQNEGYPIDTKEITIYSFFEVRDENETKTIFPVQFYYSTGSITRNATGVLEAYTHSLNHDFYIKLMDELSSIPETYHWVLDKFHIIKIEWNDILGESHTDYFTTYQFQPNQKTQPSEANKYISLHNTGFYINIQEPLNINTIIDKVKDADYNKKHKLFQHIANHSRIRPQT